MRKQAPVVEWIIAESDAEWERRRSLIPPDNEWAANRRRPLKHYFWGVTALLLLLVSIGGWWSQQAAAESSATAQRELRVVAPGENPFAARATGDPDALPWQHSFARQDTGLQGVQTADCDTQVDRSMHTVEYQGNQVVAQIITHAEPGAPAYRETYFYRCAATGWVQTAAPDAVVWGAERILETPSLVFHFPQNDAPVVVAVALQMDALYTTLHSNFGLPLALGTEKLAIEVSVTYPPGHTATWFGAPDRIIVPSPVLYRAPVELTGADLVAQSIALPMVAHGLAKASDHHTIKQSWRPLLNGLRLWQVWDLDLPLAAWQPEIVTWVYQDHSTKTLGRPAKLPARYEELCAMHKLWLSSPVQLEIPLLCGGPALEWQYWSISSWDALDAPSRLDQLVVPLQPGEYMEEMASLQRAGHPGQTAALATLIEYAVAAYGRERLPALMAGLGQYETWETLLPAVFGVSAAEFEAGWQVYLAAYDGSSWRGHH